MSKKIIVAALLAAFTIPSFAQLLKGSVKGFTLDDDGVQISYSPTGGMVDDQYTTAVVDANGNFTYDVPLSDRNSDVSIIVANQVFGVHLTKGQTVTVTLSKGNGNMLNFAVSGPSKDVSLAVNAEMQAYDMMKYFSMDESMAKSNAEYRQILEESYKSVLPYLKGIKDKQLRKFYTDLNEAQYKWMKIRLIMDKCEENGTRYQDDAEYKQLISDVDINSDISFRSNLGFGKVMAMVTSPMNFKGDMEPYCREQMALADKYVTNPFLRSDIAKSIAQNYFSFGGNTGDYHRFYADAVKWAGRDSTAFTAYKGKIASWDQTQTGTKAFDITLTDESGKTCQLSDIAKGKFTYIDVWATWCGPCKQEIPYLAKLVEKYKDNPKVQFISISIDENVDAWKRMINRDHPAWPQYNIQGDVAKTFSQQWGISGIPRFIMIDKDGNIFSADATRPSEAATSETIDKL
jgi:thiol-disulfide isomerase/thioredoxin